MAFSWTGFLARTSMAEANGGPLVPVDPRPRHRNQNRRGSFVPANSRNDPAKPCRNRVARWVTGGRALSKPSVPSAGVRQAYSGLPLRPEKRAREYVGPGSPVGRRRLRMCRALASSTDKVRCGGRPGGPTATLTPPAQTVTALPRQKGPRTGRHSSAVEDTK